MYEFIVVLELCYEDNPVLALGEGHLCVKFWAWV